MKRFSRIARFKALVVPVLLFILAAPGGAFADETPVKNRHVITAVVYNIDGRTNEDSVRRRFGSYEEMSFDSMEALETFLNTRERAMTTAGLFDSSRISHSEEPNGVGGVDVAVTVAIKSSFPVGGFPVWARYNETGTNIGLDINFPDVGGSLMTFGVVGYFNAPQYNGSFRWREGTFNVGAYLDKIDMHPFLVRLAYNYSKFIPEVDDKGVESLVWRAQSSSVMVTATAPLSRHILLTLQGSYKHDHKDHIIKNIDPSKNYPYPSKNEGSFYAELAYDPARHVEIDRKGFYGRVRLAYNLFDPLYSNKIDGQIGSEMEAAYYWIFNDWVFPSVHAIGMYYTGRAQYAFASRNRGIATNELRGNGAIAFDLDLRMHAFHIPHFVNVSFTPWVSYMLVGEPNQPYDRHNQGFSAGIDGIFVFDFMPGLTLRLTTGYDLRDKYAPSNVGRRLKIDGLVGFAY